MNFAERILEGDIRAAARLMRDIDDEIPSAREEMKLLYPHTGRAHIVGITGSPGTGKSSLVDRLIEAYRQQGKTVGVVAVDPTSPFSGGAILGDRVRMQRHSTDDGVFIRSLATRGYLGGISRSTHDIVDVMDAMGRDVVIVETVGVGQDEVEIVRMAHTTIVVLIPGMGDEIQAIKAGILEVGDIFVINKADKEGADKTVRELEIMLEMKSYQEEDWHPPIVKTQAINNIGIEELMREIERHREYLKEGKGVLKQKERIQGKFLEILKDSLFKEVKERLTTKGDLDPILESLSDRKVDPYTVVERVLREHLRTPSKVEGSPQDSLNPPCPPSGGTLEG